MEVEGAEEGAEGMPTSVFLMLLSAFVSHRCSFFSMSYF